MNSRVDAAYDAIVAVYNDPKATPEGKMIDIFGFSRGAAESRALVNKLLEEGIPVKGTDHVWVPAGTTAGGRWETQEYTEIEQPLIRFLGLFDTVPALGDPTDPDSFYHSLYAGYGQSIDFDKIYKVSHALAAEEGRVTFDLRSLKRCATCALHGNVEEVFLRGAHSDIGGGYGISEGGNYASIFPLPYMYREALEVGVPLESSPALVPLLGDLESLMDVVEEEIHDSRYRYERKLDRRERTVYYDVGSETMTYEQMMQRALEFARREVRPIVEGEDGQAKLGAKK